LHGRVVDLDVDGGPHDPAGCRLDPERAARGHIPRVRAASVTDQRRPRRLVVLDPPGLHAPDRILPTSPERKPGQVLALEKPKGQHRQVHGADDVADVVARALVADPCRLDACGYRRLEEQLLQPIVAVADRRAVHFEHVAERHPLLFSGQPHEQEV